jgi:large subunit ribosomal protein L4
LARKSALAYKAKESQIVVVEDLNYEAPKTKDFIALTKNLQVADKKILLVLPGQNKNVYLSARNLQKTSVVTASDINTYGLINCTSLLLTESSVAEIDKLFKA